MNGNEENIFDTQVPEEDIIETVQTIEVDDIKSFAIETDGAFPALGEPNEELNHNLFNNRDIPDQHPIIAITGLRTELDNIEELQTVYSDKIGVANYYQWNDAAYEECGYFVSIVPETSTIKICNESTAIFGVSVDKDEVGFIGNEGYIEVECYDESYRKNRYPRNTSYGLIMTSGLVAVRCELDVSIGDYVVSSDIGYARKSKTNYGYKVLDIVTKNSVTHAIIALGVQADVANKLGAELVAVRSRLDAAETNIVAAINVANQAYNKAIEIGKSNVEMSDKIHNILGTVDKVVTDVDNLGTQMSNSTLVSTQARAIAESAATSAESMRNEAVKKANEALTNTSALRDKFESKVAELDAELDNIAMELGRTKEEMESTRDELQGSVDDAVADLDKTKEDLKDAKNEMQDNLNDISGKFDKLADELVPLITWPDGATGDDIKGVAGFVKQAKEDSVLLGTIATWKDGDGEDSLTGYIQEVGKGYATTTQIAKVNESIAAVRTMAENNKAEISALTGIEGGLAGLQAQVNENAASVTTLASRAIGYTSIVEWIPDEKNPDVIYYAEDTNKYYYWGKKDGSENYEWIDTINPIEAGLSGTLAGIQQIAYDNKAGIEMIASLSGEFGESLAGLVSETTAENAEIKALAEYGYTDDNGTKHYGAAGIMAEVDNNKSAIEAIAGKDGSIAGLQAQVDNNSASVATLASQVIGEYTIIDTWSNISEKDKNKVYYVKNLNYYYYYNQGWKATQKPHVAGLSGALAGIQQTADSNTASIEMIAGFEGEFGDSLAGFVSNTTSENAEIKALAEYKYTDKNGKEHTSVAALGAYADDNKASIDAIVGTDGSIAGLQAQVNENQSTIDLVARRVDGTYKSVDTWSKTDKDQNVVYYAKDTKLYWYYADDDWKNTSVVSIAGLSPAITGLQMQSDNNSANIDSIAAWQNDTDTSMTRIEQKADANGAYMQSMVANIDKYQVGSNSQAFGFTIEQAAEVLTEDQTYYVPTSIETEEYKRANEAVDDVEDITIRDISKVYVKITDDVATYYYYGWNGSEYAWIEKATLKDIPTYKRTFVPGYLYKWGKINGVGHYGWTTVDKNYKPLNTDVYETALTDAEVEQKKLNTASMSVYFSNIEVAIVKGSSNDNYGYWYTNVSTANQTIYELDENGSTIESTKYKPNTLYKWDEYQHADEDGDVATDWQWVKVDALADNPTGRAVSQIRQDTNSIALEVTNTIGSVAIMKAELTDIGAKVHSISAWPSEKGGYNIALLKEETDTNGAYMTLATVRSVEDENGESVSQIEELDGAKIVLSNGYEGSFIQLDAENINMEGQEIDFRSAKSITFNTDFYQTIADQVQIDTSTLQIDAGQINMEGQVIDFTAAQEVKFTSNQVHINATNIDLAGWKVVQDAIYTDNDGYLSGMASSIISPLNSLVDTKMPSCARFFAGYTPAFEDNTFVEFNSTDEANFLVLEDGSLYAKAADIKGKIVTSSGSIAGWEMKEAEGVPVLFCHSSPKKSVGLGASTVVGDPAFWAGLHSEYGTPWEHEKERDVDDGDWTEYTPFYVTNEGGVYAKKGKIGGWEITDYGIQNTVGGLTSGFEVKHGNTVNALAIGSTRSDNWSNAPFRVTHDGTLYATKAYISGDSKIGGWTVTEHGIQNKGNNGLTSGFETQFVGGDGNLTTWALAIGSPDENSWRNAPFKVNHDGELYASKGKIGGWQITDYDLHYYDETSNRGTGFQAPNSGNWAIAVGFTDYNSWATGSSFRVSHLGEMYAIDARVSNEMVFYGGIFDEVMGKIYMKPTDFNIWTDSWSNMFKVDFVIEGQATGKNILNGEWYTKNQMINGSDRSIKNSILSISDDYDMFFDNLRPVTYKYNDGTSGRLHTGFIAQEVGDALSEANISTRDFAGLCIYGEGTKDESWWLRYNEFTSLNTWQIQKLKSRVAELEAQIASLINKN